MHTFVFPTLLAALMVLGGCTQSRSLFERDLIRDQSREIDSLRAAHTELWRHFGVLQDSLQFYDDIDSGQYYRALGLLHDRIERLEYDLAVARDGGATVEVIPTDELFAPGTAALTDAGREKLQSLGQTLKETYRKAPLRVEGHSDNVPVGPSLRDKYPSNWELSAARAAAVVRYLVEEADLAPERFTLAAYGDARPLASNRSAEGRRQNRRIRIAALEE